MIDRKYDERVYLKDDYIISSFASEAFLRNEKIKIEERNYKREINKYDLLIDKLAVFIRRLGYESSIECSMLLSYMISNGYLSIDKQYFDKEIDARKELISRLGMSIIRGNGVCRNTSAMHKEVFDRLGLYDKQLYCYQGIGTGKRSKANHVINIIEYDNNYYGIDIFNGDRLYRFISELELRNISLYYNDCLRYKPYYEISIGESSIEKVREYLNKFKDYASRRSIDPYIYDQIKFEIKRKLLLYTDAMNEFFDNNKSLIKRINNKFKGTS